MSDAVRGRNGVLLCNALHHAADVCGIGLGPHSPRRSCSAAKWQRCACWTAAARSGASRCDVRAGSRQRREWGASAAVRWVCGTGRGQHQRLHRSAARPCSATGRRSHRQSMDGVHGGAFHIDSVPQLLNDPAHKPGRNEVCRLHVAALPSLPCCCTRHQELIGAA